MKTDQRPSELINQAITNTSNQKLAIMLWECMKLAAIIEIKSALKKN